MSFDDLLRKTGGFSNLFKQASADGVKIEEAVQAAMAVGSELFKTVGYTVKRAREGEAELEFGFSEAIGRRGGMVHGGIVMYTIDNVCGLAVMTVNPGVDQLTTELKVNFLEPLRNGPFTATGKVLRLGRSMVVAEGEVRDAAGVLCAKGLGTWVITDGKRSPRTK